MSKQEEIDVWRMRQKEFKPYQVRFVDIKDHFRYLLVKWATVEPKLSYSKKAKKF